MKKYNDDSYKKLLYAPYQLIAVMGLLVILITTVSLYRLYNIGFQQQKQRLIEIVQSQAAMIDGLIEHEQGEYGYQKENGEKVALSELMYASTKFKGFGQTGEYTLGKLDKDKILFLVRHRHIVDNMMSISMDSNLAEPMRRALKGQFGTLVGLDYRGALVLAAHEPLKSVKWGIVAKIDLAEIQAPYIQEGIYGLIGSILLIIIGGAMVIYFIHPLAKEIENGRRYNRMLFNESPIGLALTNINGKMIDVNPTFLKIMGYTTQEMLNLSYWDITPKKYYSQEEEQVSKLLEEGRYGPYEKEYIHKDGHLIYVRLSGCLVENGEHLIWSSIEDITEQKRNELALKEASLVFEHTHEGIMITDADVQIVRINNKFTQITGFTSEETLGRNPKFLQSGSHDEDFYKEMWDTIDSKGTWYGELNNRRKTGEYFATLQSITAVKNDDGAVSGYVSVFSDISERKNHEIKMTYLASHDSLTSLPNRMHFHDNLDQAIYSAKRNKYKIAVLFLDLNRFKEVNDTMGHEVGDRLLQEVAKRLSECVREEDTVARLGGDEFAIILSEIKSSEDALEVAQKIIQKVGEPLAIGKNSLVPSTSIGISIYPEHGEDCDTLLKFADKAMYVAKQKKQDKYELFDLTKAHQY